MASAHRDLPLPPLPETIPVPAAGLIAELTAKDPAARPASAAEVASRAARLRDAIQDGAAVPWHTIGPDAERPTLPETPLPGLPAGRAPRPPGGLGRWPWIAALSALAVFLMIGVLSMLTAAAPPGKTAAPRQEPTLTLVDVKASSLIGLPVTAVDRELRQLGLVVRVRWQPTALAPAGMVISVQPGGQVPAGSVVVVTGALQPQPTVTSPGHDHGGGMRAVAAVSRDSCRPSWRRRPCRRPRSRRLPTADPPGTGAGRRPGQGHQGKYRTDRAQAPQPAPAPAGDRLSSPRWPSSSTRCQTASSQRRLPPGKGRRIW